MISGGEIVITFVTPDKGFIGYRKGLDDRMFGRFGMLRVVGLLRLAASDMAASYANP